MFVLLKHVVIGLRSGGKGLKASQVYPAKYGIAMARHHQKFAVIRSEISGSSMVPNSRPPVRPSKRAIAPKRRSLRQRTWT